MTMAPLGWVLNSKTINEQYRDMFLLMNKTPIFVLINNKLTAICFTQLFYDRTNVDLNALFEFKINNTIAGQIIDNNAGWWQQFCNQTMGANATAFANNERAYHDKEENNQVYQKFYADGQFTGIVSPQPNDWFQDNNIDPKSNFNNTSFIKCLFQTTMLGLIYSDTSPYYTLTNACVIISTTNDQNTKYTGKYWTKPIIRNEDLDDNQANNRTTSQLINRILTRIQNDNALRNQINDELDIIWPDKNAPDYLAYKVRQEKNYPALVNQALNPYINLANNLFNCTTGLEDTYKVEFALTISGILGHSWDYLLKFFSYDTAAHNNEQFNKFKNKYPSFEFVKHYGTPIASYIYDFKGGTSNNILGGYNAVNFSRILNYKIMNLRDKISTKTIYNPPDLPNCLIPIVFNNALLQCKTNCFRSYKKLLDLMKTRKQRDYLFDRLTHYGRRCMSILDPYGMFMHFHNDSKGIRPVNWINDGIYYARRQARRHTGRVEDNKKLIERIMNMLKERQKEIDKSNMNKKDKKKSKTKLKKQANRMTQGLGLSEEEVSKYWSKANDRPQSKYSSKAPSKIQSRKASDDEDEKEENIINTNTKPQIDINDDDYYTYKKDRILELDDEDMDEDNLDDDNYQKEREIKYKEDFNKRLKQKTINVQIKLNPKRKSSFENLKINLNDYE